ncbi:hypothetical protein RB195_015292 [Necator americanus]|uniref:Uncharacterized protein n=1 Tax=Necator americanus TaxID=51031 RepID=A0ABR1E3W3_NECAM
MHIQLLVLARSASSEQQRNDMTMIQTFISFTLKKHAAVPSDIAGYFMQSYVLVYLFKYQSMRPAKAGLQTSCGVRFMCLH